MMGLALEGGGARGAFQMGVMKALLENGYHFDGVTGTSIGAINGAMIAQGAFEEAYSLWERMLPSLLFNIDDEAYQKLMTRDIDKATIAHFASRLRSVIRNRGVDTSKIRQLLERVIDESKIRQSECLFGLVTVSLTDLKAYELYKEDIPEGRMIDYLIASATFPGFKLTEIENRRFIDGGLYNNCPINLLAQKGFNQILAIRTLAPGIFKPVKEPDVQVSYITPSDDLGRVLDFSQSLIHQKLKMGYYDALRWIKEFKGKKYTIKPEKDRRIESWLMDLPDQTVAEMGKVFGLEVTSPKHMLFDEIIPQAADRLGLSNNPNIQDVVIGLLELLAEERNIPRFEVYTFDRFVNLIKSRIPQTTDHMRLRQKLADNLFKKNQLVKTAHILIESL